MEGIELLSFQMISLNGSARSCFVEAIMAAVEIEPAEEGLQCGGRLVLAPTGRLGDGVGGGVAATAVDVLLILGEDGEDLLDHGGLSGGGHVFDGGAVKVTGLGLALQAQPGTDHHLKDAVAQMGQTQAAQRQKRLPGHG